MKGQPLLSVIVANYNNQSYIRNCLDSVLEQTYKNLEIIVSDDGSTDESPKIIKEYEKKYPGIVKGLLNPLNQGVARTRHEAILQAKGEYITTLDSDDYYYHPQKLEKEIEVTALHKKTNKDVMAYSNIALVKEDKTLICFLGNSNNLKEGKIFDDIITRSCMIPRDFIVKKAFYFEVGGYDFSFPIYEDWDLKLRLAHQYEFYYTGLNGTAYRQHEKGLSSIPLRENIMWLKRVFEKNIHLAKGPENEARWKLNQFIDRITRKLKSKPL